MCRQYAPSEHLSPKTYTWSASRGGKDLIPEWEGIKKRQVVLAFLRPPLDTRTKRRGRKAGEDSRDKHFLLWNSAYTQFAEVKWCHWLEFQISLPGFTGTFQVFSFGFRVTPNVQFSTELTSFPIVATWSALLCRHRLFSQGIPYPRLNCFQYKNIYKGSFPLSNPSLSHLATSWNQQLNKASMWK